VCPPDPPAGSNLVCAPPLVCRDAAEWQAMDASWYAKLFIDPVRREGIANTILGIEQILCGGQPTPAGRVFRGRA
jgi:hypothetical protein